MRAPLIGALFLICFFFCDLRFLFGDHLGEFGFALVSGFGVDVEFLAFAVWQSWIEAAFPKVIVYLIDASRFEASYFGLFRLEFCLLWRFYSLVGWGVLHLTQTALISTETMLNLVTVSALRNSGSSL